MTHLICLLLEHTNLNSVVIHEWSMQGCGMKIGDILELNNSNPNNNENKNKNNDNNSKCSTER